MIGMPALALAQESTPSSVWYHIVHSLPSDPASLFTLALLLASVVLVIVTGRRGGRKGRGGLPS